MDLNIFYVVSLKVHVGVFFSIPTQGRNNFMGKCKLPKLPPERDFKVEQIE